MRQRRQRKKQLLRGKGGVVFKIFFEDWKSLKEASFEYDPTYKGKKYGRGELSARSHPTVARYKQEFDKRDYLDEASISRECLRKSKYDKEHELINKSTRMRANLKPLFDFIESKGGKLDKTEERLLELFFEMPEIRNRAVEYFASKGIIDSLVQTVDDILLTWLKNEPCLYESDQLTLYQGMKIDSLVLDDWKVINNDIEQYLSSSTTDDETRWNQRKLLLKRLETTWEKNKQDNVLNEPKAHIFIQIICSVISKKHLIGLCKALLSEPMNDFLSKLFEDKYLKFSDSLELKEYYNLMKEP